MSDGWNYGVVALLDVLGFSALVEADAASPEPKHLERLVACLREARESTPAGKLDVRSFSDSIVISGDLQSTQVADVVSSIAGLQRIFMRRGVLVRGAIALGKHFADRDTIYSEALVRAHNLERDHARFPRVVVDRELLDWFLNEPSTTSEVKEAVLSRLLKDRDGHSFVHYLDGTNLEESKALLSSYDPGKLSASVLEKLQWLATYHNYVVRSTKSDVELSGPFVDAFQTLKH